METTITVYEEWLTEMAGQRWVRLDVDYFTNPKAMAAGPDGRALHLASICWAGQQFTDGNVPGEVVDLLRTLAGVGPKSVDKVVAAGLWLPLGGSFDIKDFVEMNGTRADYEREREQHRARQRQYARKRWDGTK